MRWEESEGAQASGGRTVNRGGSDWEYDGGAQLAGGRAWRSTAGRWEEGVGAQLAGGGRRVKEHRHEVEDGLSEWEEGEGNSWQVVEGGGAHLSGGRRVKEHRQVVGGKLIEQAVIGNTMMEHSSQVGERGGA